MNHAALLLFLALGTQWRLAPRHRPAGLDYAAAAGALALQGKRGSADLFARLQVLEAAALTRFAETDPHG